MKIVNCVVMGHDMHDNLFCLKNVILKTYVTVHLFLCALCGLCGSII
jgi:hypothetical protein